MSKLDLGGVKLDTDKLLEAGDHIYIILDTPIIYEHHGIYIGNFKVIHFSNWIVETNLREFASNQVVRKAPD